MDGLDEPWVACRFFSAGPEPREEYGYARRGLALTHAGWADNRRITRWTLWHIGSGGRLAEFTGDVATVFPAAYAVAECADWTAFDMPQGWRQTDPDAPSKLAAVLEMHPEASPVRVVDAVTDDQARAVVAAREALDRG